MSTLALRYGDIMMLFNRSHMRNMVAISPMDTGAFCHSAAKPKTQSSPNCAAWDRSMGTLTSTLTLKP